MDAKAIPEKEDRQIVWKRKRFVPAEKQNAALIIKHSNAIAFRCQRGKFMCAFCPKISTNMTDLRSHTNEHNNLDVFETNKIRICLPVNIEITDLICKVCNKFINNTDELKRHLNDFHNIKINPNCPDGVVPYRLVAQEYVCACCDMRFDKFPTLSMHMNKHFPSFVCDSCGKGFTADYKLRSHKAIHDLGQFKCSKCDMVFANRSARLTHIDTKHRSKVRHRCPICDEHFASYYSRLKHLQTTHGESSEYYCTYCPAVFKTSNSKYLHQLSVHLKIKKNRKRDIEGTEKKRRKRKEIEVDS